MRVITSEELAGLLGISERKANRILRTVNEELQREGYLILNTRPLRAPLNKVMERLGLKEEQ